MTKKSRPTYSPEFRLEAAQLVTDQNYSVVEATKAMNVSKSAMDSGFASLRTNVQAVHLKLHR